MTCILGMAMSAWSRWAVADACLVSEYKIIGLCVSSMSHRLDYSTHKSTSLGFWIGSLRLRGADAFEWKLAVINESAIAFSISSSSFDLLGARYWLSIGLWKNTFEVLTSVMELGMRAKLLPFPSSRCPAGLGLCARDSWLIGPMS